MNSKNKMYIYSRRIELNVIIIKNAMVADVMIGINVTETPLIIVMTWK